MPYKNSPRAGLSTRPGRRFWPRFHDFIATNQHLIQRLVSQLLGFPCALILRFGFGQPLGHLLAPTAVLRRLFTCFPWAVVQELDVLHHHHGLVVSSYRTSGARLRQQL